MNYEDRRQFKPGHLYVTNPDGYEPTNEDMKRMFDLMSVTDEELAEVLKQRASKVSQTDCE